MPQRKPTTKTTWTIKESLFCVENSKKKTWYDDKEDEWMIDLHKFNDAVFSVRD